MAASHAALTSALESDLLDRVREASPGFFESLIVDLLIAMGYGGGRAEMGQAIGRAEDGGIDGIIKQDALGLDIVYVQAKRYAAQNTVGRSEVQSFAGSLDGVGATKGIFVTTSSLARAHESSWNAYRKAYRADRRRRARAPDGRAQSRCAHPHHLRAEQGRRGLFHGMIARPGARMQVIRLYCQRGIQTVVLMPMS
jgi:restriction endonuclease Mrr